MLVGSVAVVIHTARQREVVQDQESKLLAMGETLFEREPCTDPNWHYWNGCAAASDQLVEARTLKRPDE